MRALLAVLVAACSAPPAPRPPAVTPPPAAPSATPARRAFTVRTVKVRHDGSGLAAGARLHSNDRFDLLVDLDGTAYIYVVRVVPGGALEVLYPAATAPPLSGTVRIPTDPRQIFQLDDQVGEERLYVVATEAPIAEGEPAVERAIRSLELDAPAAEAPPAPPPADAGVAVPAPEPHPHVHAHRPQGRTEVAIGELHEDQRRVELVTTDADGAACTDITPSQDGIAACRFTIQHVP